MNRINPLAICFVLLMTGATQADLTVEFSVDGGASFTTTQTLTAGDTATIEVYLRDTEATGSLVNDGLFGFGLLGTGFDVSKGSRQNTAIDPVFDFSVDESTESEIRWNGNVFNNAAPTGQDILLGSFDWVTSNAGTTVLSFSDIDPGSGTGNASWVTAASEELDQRIFDPLSGGQLSYDLTIVAVPEPTAASFLLCFGVFCSVSRRRV